MEDKSEEYIRVLKGDFDHLPPMSSTVIKIFLSSTFSDFKAERNTLMERVYPRLSQYCREKYGVEFQVSDMRWGVPDYSDDDHSGPKLCYDEISHCQQESLSVNFVALIGNRSGRRPPPAMIDAREFDIVMKHLEGPGGRERGSQILEDCYLLDENCVPPARLLKPLVSTFKEVTNAERQTAREAWKSKEILLNEKLREAVANLQSTGSLNEEEGRKYFSSVTENEIVQGIINKRDANVAQFSMAFLRDLQWRDKSSDFKGFVDEKSDGSVDSSLQTRLNEMKANLKRCFPAGTSLFEYPEVPFSAMVDESETAKIEKEAYLGNLCHDFQENVRRLVDSSLQARSQLYSDTLFVDALQHATTCVTSVETFHGREEIRQRVSQYISSDEQVPLVIHGESGSGKTSLMAKCAREVRATLSENVRDEALVIVRFLGTSQSTSGVAKTLQSLADALGAFLPDTMSESNSDENFQSIERRFHDNLASVANDRPVYLFLDSLDQLDSSDGCYYLGWVPRKLPSNVKLVLSLLSNMHGLLDTLKARYSAHSSDCFIEVPSLGPSLCKDILHSRLQASQRRLTSEQIALLEDAFAMCSLPLYTSLLLTQALTWHSYDSADELRGQLHSTVRGFIQQWFQRLEMKHGKIMTSHVLAYITASRSGLSEVQKFSIFHDVVK